MSFTCLRPSVRPSPSIITHHLASFPGRWRRTFGNGGAGVDPGWRAERNLPWIQRPGMDARNTLPETRCPGSAPGNGMNAGPDIDTGITGTGVAGIQDRPPRSVERGTGKSGYPVQDGDGCPGKRLARLIFLSVRFLVLGVIM